MAIEIRNDVSTRETRAPMLGDPVLTTDTVERLKVPDEIALRPENVMPFLASQWGRYNDIVNRPEIKALSADIPSTEEYAGLQIESVLMPEEQAALQSWNEERFAGGGTLGVQTVEELDSEIGRIVNESQGQRADSGQGRGRNPTATRGSAIDPFDMMFTNEVVQETEDQKRKWQELIAAAKGSPDMVNTIIGMRYAKKMTQKIGKLTELYKYHTDAMDKLSAQFDLKSSGGQLAQADLAKFNADFARAQTDTSNTFQMLQNLMGEYQRVTQFTSTIDTEIDRTIRSIIQNFRS